MRVKKIRLMADYGCDPLWGEDADNIGDIDPYNATNKSRYN